MASRDPSTEVALASPAIEDNLSEDELVFASADIERGPDEVYQELVEAARDGRRIKSLKALKHALDTMSKTGATDFSVASVARGIEMLKYKGPKEQSIRNREGGDFRRLILVYKAAHGKRKNVKRATDDDDLAAAIPDFRVAAQVRWIMNENRALKRRNDLLHEQFKRLTLIRKSSSTSIAGPAGQRFTEEEVRAIKDFIRMVDQSRFAFEKPSGALVDQLTQFEIGPPGFHQVLLKIVNGEGT